MSDDTGKNASIQDMIPDAAKQPSEEDNTDFIQGGKQIGGETDKDKNKDKDRETDDDHPHSDDKNTTKTMQVSALEDATRPREPPGAGSTDAMKPISNSDYTVVVHTDPSIEYDCPTKDGNWTHNNVLAGTLTGSITSGPGCYVRFTFTGDAVTMYGGTGPKFGVFQCSTTGSEDLWEATGAWNAFGQTNFFKAYQGSCTIAGLGYSRHQVTLTNSPHNPKSLVFTGLMFRTNRSAVQWAAPQFDACCPAYTFPEGATTTISEGNAKPTTPGSQEGNTSIENFNWKSILAIV
ncbi:hypothetical protein OIV83_003581 [Microbotryomycetes sp. JL201]|nr:hypothetical protein OIV83_003581 [Microbotryomycetes sp. JL201]